MKVTTGLTLILFSLLLVSFAGKASAAVDLNIDSTACAVAAEDDDGKQDGDKKKGDKKEDGEAEPDCD